MLFSLKIMKFVPLVGVEPTPFLMYATGSKPVNFTCLFIGAW